MKRPISECRGNRDTVIALATAPRQPDNRLSLQRHLQHDLVGVVRVLDVEARCLADLVERLTVPVAPIDRVSLGQNFAFEG
jgi:hypothetical protein